MVLIPYSQYIGALVLIACWSGQYIVVTSPGWRKMGGDGVEVTYDHYNYSDTEATYYYDNNDHTEEGWIKAR